MFEEIKVKMFPDLIAMISRLYVSPLLPACVDDQDRTGPCGDGRHRRARWKHAPTLRSPSHVKCLSPSPRPRPYPRPRSRTHAECALGQKDDAFGLPGHSFDIDKLTVRIFFPAYPSAIPAFFIQVALSGTYVSSSLCRNPLRMREGVYR
jgi:hypothetical protein